MKKSICRNCSSYNLIYTRGFFMFWKEKQGYCTKCQNLVGEKGKCASYALRAYEETTTIQKLDIAINDIMELEKIYSAK